MNKIIHFPFHFEQQILLSSIFFFLSFGTRPNNNNSSGTITGADYEDIRQDMRRSHGNQQQQRSNRYHRETNGSLNFYDYEDVEKDRKKFLGKARRHEAEEVDETK